MSEIAERRTKREEEAKLIEHMLDEVEADLQDKERTSDFIASLREQFDEVRTLSPRQVEALRKFYDNL